MLIYLIIALSLTICCYSIYDEWQIGNETLPRGGDALMAVGVWNGSAHIIGGGNNPRQYFTFNGSTITDVDVNYTDVNIFGLGQYYTTIGPILYTISTDDPLSISYFNMQTKLFTPIYTYIPVYNYVSIYACLASTNDLLVVAGGGYLKTVQIYNMTNGEWSNGPDMNYARGKHGCLIHSDRLYAIGGSNGQPLRSVETMNMQNMTHFDDTMNLLETVTNLRVVTVGNYIIIVSGWQAGDYTQKIQIINTINNTITWGGNMAYKQDYATPFVLQNAIYVFGGEATQAGIPYYSTYQYAYIYNVPTVFPSTSPTTSLPTAFGTYILNETNFLITRTSTSTTTTSNEGVIDEINTTNPGDTDNNIISNSVSMITIATICVAIIGTLLLIIGVSLYCKRKTNKNIRESEKHLEMNRMDNETSGNNAHQNKEIGSNVEVELIHEIKRTDIGVDAVKVNDGDVIEDVNKTFGNEMDNINMSLPPNIHPAVISKYGGEMDHDDEYSQDSNTEHVTTDTVTIGNNVDNNTAI
eukprot:460896_1